MQAISIGYEGMQGAANGKEKGEVSLGAASDKQNYQRICKHAKEGIVVIEALKTPIRQYLEAWKIQ
jgi:hypothetical protein